MFRYSKFIPLIGKDNVEKDEKPNQGVQNAEKEHVEKHQTKEKTSENENQVDQVSHR